MRYAEVDGRTGLVRYVGDNGLEVLPEFAFPLKAVAVGKEIMEGDYIDISTGEKKMPGEAEINEVYRPKFDKKRDRLFRETEWVRQRHSDRKALGIDSTTNWQAWLDYWQALRDMPEQAEFDPREPVWPEKPE